MLGFLCVSVPPPASELFRLEKKWIFNGVPTSFINVAKSPFQQKIEKAEMNSIMLQFKATRVYLQYFRILVAGYLNWGNVTSLYLIHDGLAAQTHHRPQVYFLQASSSTVLQVYD